MVALVYNPSSLGEAKTRGAVQVGELEFSSTLAHRAPTQKKTKTKYRQ